MQIDFLEGNNGITIGDPLLEPDDPRIALFAERNTISTGEIVRNMHVAWVAGVKK